ncbi:ribonuclease p protein subunit, partial [Moniliophthora roreri]
FLLIHKSFKPTNWCDFTDKSCFGIRSLVFENSIRKRDGFFGQIDATCGCRFVNSLGYSSETIFLSIGPVWSENFPYGGGCLMR